MRYFVFLLLFCGCISSAKVENDLVSMQIIDRNGFSETVSSKDRLAGYEKTDFLANQPYQKVLRVYGKDKEGKSVSKVTDYHENGQIHQYLEIANGRAHGYFRKWHPNGSLHIEALVIEGTPDITESAQMTWLFDQLSRVWDEEGNLTASIPYEKGALQGPSCYFHKNGALAKRIPYHQDKIEGVVELFDPSGKVVESIEYKKGLCDGSAKGPNYQESYQAGLLEQGEYFQEGKLIAKIENGAGQRALFKEGKLFSLTDFAQGVPSGSVQIFSPLGELKTKYGYKEGKKTGEEWEYWPSLDGKLHPKLCINWEGDAIQGSVKTWYDNDVMESQREMHANKKHGLCLAWYKDSSLMLMEEYEEGKLMKGSYFKRGETSPVSKIENGKGTATLYTKEGHFHKKISYDKGSPQGEGGE